MDRYEGYKYRAYNRPLRKRATINGMICALTAIAIWSLPILFVMEATK
jgi:hypothetical protein